MSVQLPGAQRRDPIVAGLRFALQRADPPGEPQRPPALLLHGVPETAYMWRELLPDLGRDRIVLAPDLKGLGDSEARGPYDTATLVRELAALVRAEVAGPVDVVGHDWGGTLGVVLAARDPELVRRVVVLNAPYRHVDYFRGWHMLLFSTPGLPKILFQLGGRRAVEQLLRAGWRAAEPLDPDAVAHYASAYEPPERVEAMLNYYRAATRPKVTRFLQKYAEPLLPIRGGGADSSAAARPPAPSSSAQPALVVWGARDPVMPLSVGEAAVRDLGARTEMVTVPDAGHFVVEEAPRVVIPAVRKFLDSTNR